jgi:nitrous oxide reductase
VSEKLDHRRRRLLGTAALTIAAAQLGLLGSAEARSGETSPATGVAPTDATATQPGRISAFGVLR